MCHLLANVCLTLYGLEIESVEDVGILINLSLPTVLNTFVDYQFCMLALSLKQRFTWLNEDIEYGIGLLKCAKLKSFRPWSFDVSNGFLQDKVRYRLEQIRFRHFQLCTMCEHFNNIHSFRILVTITQSFFTIVIIVVYAGRRTIVFKDITSDYILYAYLQISLATFQICSLAIACSYTASEAAKTGLLIHTLLYAQRKAKWKHELYFEIINLSIQVFRHRVVFYGGYLFPVNETLLFAVNYIGVAILIKKHYIFRFQVL
ncbi:hypothetical protein FQR65_LT08865 [Abscondita terminalis]|nr:hypothetical protein FQR65_LT08865 [Abscondita terminalis]